MNNFGRSPRWSVVFAGLVLLFLALPHQAGASDIPQSWELRKSTIVDLPRTHPAASYLPDLVKRLASRQGGGSPVSEAEFLALFDRPESREGLQCPVDQGGHASKCTDTEQGSRGFLARVPDGEAGETRRCVPGGKERPAGQGRAEIRGSPEGYRVHPDVGIGPGRVHGQLPRVQRPDRPVALPRGGAAGGGASDYGRG